MVDKKKIESCLIKLRVTPDTRTRLNHIYQWVLTKHIRLDEFAEIYAWCVDNQVSEPEMSVPANE